MKYLNWIAKMVEIDKLGEMPKDATDYSFYITRVINSAMAELCLAKHRGKDKVFRMGSLLTKEERNDLCDLLTIIFEGCVKHEQLKINLKEFTEKNNFDYYYRFLVYLIEHECYVSFNRLCLSLVTLLSTTTYQLPSLYRTYEYS